MIAVGPGGQVARVRCDFCGSQHNHRGQGDDAERSSRPRSPTFARPGAPRLSPRPSLPSATAVPSPAPEEPAPEEPAPVPAVRPPTHGVPVPDRERSWSVDDSDPDDLESTLRRVLREELGLTPGLPAPKWRGGEVVLRPGRPGLQEKSWPVDSLFHKVVMIRNRLRTLEQQLNAADIPEDLKLRLQAYVSGCYGSLTSFNVLFADEADQFKGSGGD